MPHKIPKHHLPLLNHLWELLYIYIVHMTRRLKFVYYSALIGSIRSLFILALYFFKVYIPFMVSKNVYEIYEYIELFRSSSYKSYMKNKPFYYYIIKRLKFVYPNISVKFLMTIFIFIFDFLAGILLYNLVKYLLKVYKKEDVKNTEIFGTKSVKHSKTLPRAVFTVYLLNPASVFYNYATNQDGYKYFLLILSVYASVFSNQAKSLEEDNSSNQKKFRFSLAKFRFPTWLCDLIFVFFILNSSHMFMSLLFPVIYLRTYNKVQLSEKSIKMKEFLAILKQFMKSTTLVLLVLKILGFRFWPYLTNPYRSLDSHPSIDFSYSWYLNELLPVEFVKGTLFKNHFMGLLFTLPLLVGMRKYPFDYLMIMTCISILLQGEMTILGITFILIVLMVNYQVLERTQPFSKLVHTILALLIISVFAYASWIGRYMANPNYFFGPQIAILIIICIILEDYTKMVYFRHIFTSETSAES